MAAFFAVCFLIIMAMTFLPPGVMGRSKRWGRTTAILLELGALGMLAAVLAFSAWGK